MNKETQPIDRETLLKEANKIIREHEDTLAGIEATGVTQRNGVLVFTGDYFLDEQGLPTAKSTAVFNMFKHLAHVLSENITWLISKTRGLILAFVFYINGFCPRCHQRNNNRSALSAALPVNRSMSRLRCI